MVQAPKPAGLSVWDAELLDHIESHLETEGALLAAYRDVAAASRTDYVSYLVNLIFEDEVQHHRLFAELANALRATVERTEGPRVPYVMPVENRDALLEVTERLLEAERSDARELARLAKHEGLRSMRGNSLWPLLVELMERDTEKHQTILRFIRDQLVRQPGS